MAMMDGTQGSDVRPPMATCHADDEPLVMTFEAPGYEFICMVCRTRYEFFGPKAVEWTEQRQARLDELEIEYQKKDWR